jgi:PilZ domain
MASSHAREYHRLPVHGSIYFSSGDGVSTGTVCNVSLGGWCVRSDTHVQPGASLTLFATLPDRKQAVLVDQAKVCWSHGHEFGLSIQKIAPADAARLKGFIVAHT